MSILIFGILAIVALLVVVMGAPLVYYLKREKRWLESGKTLEEWYR